MVKFKRPRRNMQAGTTINALKQTVAALQGSMQGMQQWQTSGLLYYTDCFVWLKDKHPEVYLEMLQAHKGAYGNLVANMEGGLKDE